ncbi:MAG: hypothetical protein ABMA64_05985 [Myxococcota bacterium]
MGRLQLTSGTTFGLRELAYTTVVGRHWSCDVLLPHEDAPLRWIELRWMLGKWGWRALSREGDTLGPSTWLSPGWRLLEPGKKGTVKLREVATVELVDASPPGAFAVDLQSGRVLVKQALQDLLADAGYHHWRTTLGQPLADGEVLVIGGRPLRLHLPQRALATETAAPSLLHTDTLLKLDREHLTGAFEFGAERIELPTEFVRLLIPYAEALLNEYDDDAWRTRDDAYDRWLELGGNPESTSERLGWLRGKLKAFLTKAGLADVEALFESKRVGQWYGTRIALALHQVVLE